MIQQVTEAALAEVFQECGQIVDCRICGDPHTAMRFAFIEFAQELSMQRVSSHAHLRWICLATIMWN